VAEKVASLKPGHGLDASTGEYVDMFEAGIVEPAKVTRSALQTPRSIRRAVPHHRGSRRDKPEKAGAAPAGGGMGGDMDF